MAVQIALPRRDLRRACDYIGMAGLPIEKLAVVPASLTNRQPEASQSLRAFQSSPADQARTEFRSLVDVRQCDSAVLSARLSNTAKPTAVEGSGGTNTCRAVLIGKRSPLRAFARTISAVTAVPCLQPLAASRLSEYLSGTAGIRASQRFLVAAMRSRRIVRISLAKFVNKASPRAVT
jgi:hypothetical protein